MIAEKNKGGWTLKWTNSNMTSTFAAQTVSLDLTGYTEVKIEFKFTDTTTNSTYLTSFGRIGQGEYSGIYFGQFTATGAMYFYARYFTPTSAGIQFAICNRKQTTSTAVAETKNEFLIPHKIWVR